MYKPKRVWDKRTGNLVYVDSVKDFIAEEIVEVEEEIIEVEETDEESD